MLNYALSKCRLPRYVAIIAVTLATALPVVGLEVAPTRLEIISFDDTPVITLTHNGAPLPAASISSVKLYVEKHDYDHMITVIKADGKITIRPTKDLELGLYELRIKTAHGDALVEVVSLQGIADAGLEARARRQGVDVAAIKTQLGISQTLGREKIELSLPPSYNVGQRLSIAMSPGAGRTGIWQVNGEPVAADGGTLSYVLEQTGVYDVAYIEKEGDRTVAVGLGTVVVSAEPPVGVSIAAGTKTTLQAPDGYGKYAWTVDGVDGGADAAWSGSFDGAGMHRVQVRASEPTTDGAQPFRVLSYLVTVK